MQIDIHAFLFSDMLLGCKNLNKKSAPDQGKVKVIRQPYLVDRLLCSEVTKEAGCLALVYLSEFNVAASAFTLHSSEAKVIRVSLGLCSFICLLVCYEGNN